MLVITVDTNAGEDAVYAALEKCGAGVNNDYELRRQRLDVGDVCISHRDTSNASNDDSGDTDRLTKSIVVERKTWADLCASICDGRLAEQKSRMVDETNVRYMYAIEGAEVHSWDGFHRGSMRQKCMWGALLKMQLRDGFGVVHTRAPDDTAALVRYLGQQLMQGGLATGDGCRNSSASSVLSGVQKRKRDNLTDNPTAVLRGMLTVVPGMSATRAESVVSRFPTVAALSATAPADLAEIPCGARKLGPKLAAAIKQVFH